jgi:hypothetical protein
MPSDEMRDLLQNEEYREAQAEASYYRERMDEAALEQEQDVSGEYAYFVLDWKDISDFAKRPYRTAVAQVCDSLLERVAA